MFDLDDFHDAPIHGIHIELKKKCLILVVLKYDEDKCNYNKMDLNFCDIDNLDINNLSNCNGLDLFDVSLQLNNMDHSKKHAMIKFLLNGNVESPMPSISMSFNEFSIEPHMDV